MQQNLSEFRIHLKEELTPSRKERGKYECPIPGCGSSDAFSVEKDGIHGKCFSCNWYGDIYDLYAARDNLSPQEAARAVIAKYGGGSFTPTGSQSTRAATSEPERDFSGFYEATRAALKAGGDGVAFLANERKITAQTARKAAELGAAVGYDPDKKRLIFECSPRYYAARSIYKDGAKHSGLSGAPELYMSAGLYTGQPCFIVEAPLCALSIVQAGGSACALLGTSGGSRLLAQIKKKAPSAPLILCLDNDGEENHFKGQEAQAELSKKLTEAGIEHISANTAELLSGRKDPNQLLQEAPELLSQAVKAAMAQAISHAAEAALLKEREQEEERRLYQEQSAAGYMDAFIASISNSKNNPPIPTGFSAFDRLLDGGLFAGLYFIGAISSLGKTSFVLQMADNIAQAGTDVLYFSLEMSKYELTAKSLSRLTYKISKEKGLPQGIAKTTRGIMTGKRYSAYSKDELQLIGDAMEAYKQQIAPRIWFFEGIGDIGEAQIREKVEQHLLMTGGKKEISSTGDERITGGRRPVVIVDYIQILSPSDPRATDKMNTDKNVLELKRLSRDLSVPIVGISSLNRDNYTAPINMAAFKESGAIEYGSDCLIGLQYKGMDYQEGEGDKNREKRIRELRTRNETLSREGKAIDIEVRILKNRNGGRGTSDPLKYVPMFNHFTEVPEGFTEIDSAEADSVFGRKRR